MVTFAFLCLCGPCQCCTLNRISKAYNEKWCKPVFLLFAGNFSVLGMSLCTMRHRSSCRQLKTKTSRIISKRYLSLFLVRFLHASNGFSKVNIYVEKSSPRSFPCGSAIVEIDLQRKFVHFLSNRKIDLEQFCETFSMQVYRLRFETQTACGCCLSSNNIVNREETFRKY